MTSPDILDILNRDGPLTGAELLEKTRAEPLPLWRLCRGCPGIYAETIGRRFLRLDRAVEGYARLSPSVRREFLTYTVLGNADRPEAVTERALRLQAQIEQISRIKSNLAREAMASIVADLRFEPFEMERVVFLIAGDITYGMGHTAPRPESSTGTMVRGSDLDIIVVATDDFPEEAMLRLDDAIYRKKHFLLVHPDYREEIDYVIKRLSKVEEQLRFDTFEHMVASKILHESLMLCGGADVYETIKRRVRESGVPEKLAALEARAVRTRSDAEAFLRSTTDDLRTGEHFNLFYTREEGDEIY